MRKLLAGLVLMALSTTAIAETRDPVKPPPRPVKRNPCAEFGPGFVMVDGTSTCVKIGGSISVGVGSGPPR